jgi:hypothetical protein
MDDRRSFGSDRISFEGKPSWASEDAMNIATACEPSSPPKTLQIVHCVYGVASTLVEPEHAFYNISMPFPLFTMEM